MIKNYIVPLGDTSEENTQMIPEAMANVDAPVDEFVQEEVRAGRMTTEQAAEISIRFKAGTGQPLTEALQQQYQSQYRAQPLTLAQIHNYAQTVNG